MSADMHERGQYGRARVGQAVWDRRVLGEAPLVPTVPELLTQFRALDAQIQQTDREIALRRVSVYPQGSTRSAELAALQAAFVRAHWRPFVASWNWGMREVREYEAGTRSPGSRPLIEWLTWLTRMGERYDSLRQSAGASFYVDVSMPRDAFRAAIVEGEQDMSAYAGNYVGAEGQSYPEVASRTVRRIHSQQRSPLYGYIRSGNNEKIYLFNLLEDARTWFDQHMQAQPEHDYAAVFSASNLSAPIAGMEHFMRTTVGCGVPYVGCDAHVGNWWPFFLGLPLGGAAGYFLRRWQEPESARAQVPSLRDAARPLLAPQAPQVPAPQSSGDPYVGGPWLDLVGQQYGDFGDFGASDSYGYADPLVGGPWLDMVGPQVGGPWLDMVGPQVGGPWLDIVGAQADDAARRRSWPQTRALIQSAMDEVKNYVANFPAAAAYVWTLDAPASGPYTSSSGAIITPEGTTNVVPFSSQAEALTYLREVAQTKPVALAMFERSSSHWPNPIAWRKSDEPEHEQVIAQHVANRTPTQTSGTYAGADTVIGAAIDDVRRRAQGLADRRAGNVIGVIHTSKDGLWHTLAFRTADDADDWLNTATQDQEAYTYAAYFDKEGDSWPAPYIEKIGGIRPARRTDIVGAALDDYRTLAKQYASAKPGRAAGAILNTEGRWRVYGFTSLDDAIDWLQQATREKALFTYAGAFEKDRGGTAYLQDEEMGGIRAPAPPSQPIPREFATTSGDW